MKWHFADCLIYCVAGGSKVYYSASTFIMEELP